MSWLIQRTAPLEPVAYWGLSQRWIPRRVASKIGHVLRTRIPEGALVSPDYDVAFDIAQWLRAHEPLAYGEVIAVVPVPEAAG